MNKMDLAHEPYNTFVRTLFQFHPLCTNFRWTLRKSGNDCFLTCR